VTPRRAGRLGVSVSWGPDILVRADRFTKRRLYQEVGIPTCWAADPDRQVIEVWTPDATTPTVERESLRWPPAGAAAPFVLAIPGLFRPV
jgi:hypothetical protein